MSTDIRKRPGAAYRKNPIKRRPISRLTPRLKHSEFPVIGKAKLSVSGKSLSLFIHGKFSGFLGKNIAQDVLARRVWFCGIYGNADIADVGSIAQSTTKKKSIKKKEGEEGKCEWCNSKCEGKNKLVDASFDTPLETIICEECFCLIQNHKYIALRDRIEKAKIRRS